MGRELLKLGIGLLVLAGFVAIVIYYGGNLY